jgi:hypothetical protein
LRFGATAPTWRGPRRTEPFGPAQGYIAVLAGPGQSRAIADDALRAMQGFNTYSRRAVKGMEVPCQH